MKLHPLLPAPRPPAYRRSCVVDLEGAVERQWRIQRIQEVLVAKGGRYILVRSARACPAPALCS